MIICVVHKMKPYSTELSMVTKICPFQQCLRYSGNELFFYCSQKWPISVPCHAIQLFTPLFCCFFRQSIQSFIDSLFPVYSISLIYCILILFYSYLLYLVVYSMFILFHVISYTVNSFYHLDLCVWSNTLQDQNRSCKKMRLALLPLLANKVPAWHRIQVNFKEHLWSVATKKQVVYCEFV